ncbi:MAG: hypothetical protein JW928_09085, partial [Candidatus Aureabacteria bacterium]|nr:hypothetical protein [Candidatus Auribacterota bacterium]
FLKGKIFQSHKALVDKNESADRFGYRSMKGGAFGPDALKERERITRWLSSRKKEGFQGMIHFGIGGQALGNRAQIETMGMGKDVRIKVVEKIGTNMSELFNEFRKNHIPAHRILLHASSKSGTTDETLIAFQDALHALCIELAVHLEYGAVFGEDVFHAFRTYLKKSNQGKSAVVFSKADLNGLSLDKKGRHLLQELFRRVVFTTTLSKEQSRFYAFARSPLIRDLMGKEGLAVFSIPDNVGGRFSELCQSGAVTTGFAGRSPQKQFAAGKKLIPLLESHDPEANPALKLACFAHLMDPDVIVFAYPLYYMKAEAQQKAQLFPESNGKNKEGAFVVTAVGPDELNRKVERLLKLSPQKPPLVIVQNTASLDASVPLVELDKNLRAKVPCFTFTRESLSEENLAASALFFQEFTVRYGILRTSRHFSDKKLDVRKLSFSKKSSKEFKAYSETDPQNQPFVELAKKSVSIRAGRMFKEESTAMDEIGKYYTDMEGKVKNGPVVEDIIITGEKTDNISKLLSKEALEKMDKASMESYSKMEDEVLFGAVSSLLELHPKEWYGRSPTRDRKDIESLKRSRRILEDISVLGNCPLTGEMEEQAKKLAGVLAYAQSQGKIPLPIFYSPSDFAEMLGLFYVYLTGFDYGIGTREQHSFFQSILDGLDKTFTLLFDFTSPLSLIKEKERQIFTFGMAKDYLHNFYPDTVRRLFLEEEANAIAQVKRSAATVRLKGLDNKESVIEAFRFIARGVYLKNAVH